MLLYNAAVNNNWRIMKLYQRLEHYKWVMKSTNLYYYDDLCHDYEVRAVGLVSFSQILLATALLHFIHFTSNKRGSYTEHKLKRDLSP